MTGSLENVLCRPECTQLVVAHVWSTVTVHDTTC